MASNYDKFLKFHQENPHIYTHLVQLARKAKARGRRKIGIQLLFEVIRWHHLVNTNAIDFKMNNNHSPFYARMIMENEHDLEGIFEIREKKGI